jgi:hypothetical protein
LLAVGIGACGGGSDSDPSADSAGGGPTGGSGANGGSPSGGAGNRGGAEGGEAGTEGGSGGLAPVANSMLSACRAYLNATCERRHQCGMLNDPLSCSTAFGEACPDYLFGPGSTRTVEGTFACAEELLTFDCDLLAAGFAPDCSTPGTRAPGERCFSPIQCASHSCSGNVSGCGECVMRVGPGDSCGSDRECPVGYACGAERLCIEYVPERLDPPQDRAVGETCATNDRCPDGYLCLLFEGAETRVCAVLPAEGEPCALGVIASIRCQAEYYCDPESQLCEAAPTTGEECGYFPAGLVPCGPGNACFTEGEEGLGVCVAEGGVGDPCPEDGMVSATLANCQSGLVCNDDAICVTLLREGAACGGALEVCEPATDCIDSVCTASDEFRQFEETCGE